MTVSCPGYGRVWGSKAFSQSLADLSTLGVNWVAIHPYASIRTHGLVGFTAAHQTGYLARAVQRAKHAGLYLFWKPHLAYWGSFDWRGSIAFTNDASRKRFAKTYRAFILDQARFAQEHKIPLFAVGVELERLTHYEEYWRQLIRDVRHIYSGKLTYAANWDGIRRVKFWDALDYIGVQGYFPLVDKQPPLTLADLRKGWQKPLANLRDLSQQTTRPIIFTEIGYPSAPHAARQPWKTRSFGQNSAPKLRQKLVEVALQLLGRQDMIAGMFWWKWIPGRLRGDFAMQPPEIRSLLRAYWTQNSSSNQHSTEQ
ncbi:MAG: hypothetical protein KTR25_08815 [Myxococcales bacterium]|nr:hypothetical protein [Myxococcales bacterium]